MKDRLFIVGKPEFVNKFSSKTTLSHTVYRDGNHQMFVFGKQSRIKCKPRTGKHLQDWEDVCKIFPNPKLSIKWEYTKAHITMEPMPESYTFVVVARPKPSDRKRMILVAFSKQSEIEENVYVVHVYLYDDIKVLFEVRNDVLTYIYIYIYIYIVHILYIVLKLNPINLSDFT